MQASPDVLYLLSATACAGFAAVADLKSRRIPNWLTGPAFLLALGLHAALGGARGFGLSLSAGLLAGVIFLVFFLAGGMGAGDVKLMAAVGALAGLHPLGGLLATTAVLGAVLALGTALRNGRLRETVGNTGALLLHHQAHGLLEHPELNVRNAALLRMPFAIPIAGGCVSMLLAALYGAGTL